MNPHAVASAGIDFSPALRLLTLAAGLALLPLGWWWWRHRAEGPALRRHALTLLTLFLTFDLVVFGAFTRLTDSGLGCPDWPGCYGATSPFAASAHISRAESIQPHGPVTVHKAWIEMIHRYLAMTVGALMLVLAVMSTWWRRSLPFSVAWPWITLVWVIVQGLFGKYTVTLKLYPAIVTLHLFGGLLLLALLVFQVRRHQIHSPAAAGTPPQVLTQGARALLKATLLLLVVQVLLGAWVSTNYAVLACQGFPQCNGEWWPSAMDAAQGFTVLRHLGRAGEGGFLSFEALVAIHWAHRVFALILVAALALLSRALWRQPEGRARRAAKILIGLVLLQVGTGAANVVLQWPLLAALLHTAGAGALVMLLVSTLVSPRLASRAPLPSTECSAAHPTAASP